LTISREQVGQVGAHRSLFDPADTADQVKVKCPECDHPIPGAHFHWCAVVAPKPDRNRRPCDLTLLPAEEEALAALRLARGQAELDAAADLLRETLGAEEVE